MSRVKNEQIPLEHFYSSSCGEEIFRKIYREYDERLKRNRLIDFDDMLIQLRSKSFSYKLKSNNYSELTVVDVADMWRERNVWYQGRSCQQVETEYETCSNNEWQEVSRGHSTIVVANIMGRTEL